jgi:cytochrome c oxidase cbb3-type subunit 3
MRRHLLSLVSLSLLLTLGLALAGCPREKRSFHSSPARNARPLPVRLVTLQPGAPLPKQAASGPYEGNAWAINQGERLYEQYNCVGCHFHGGGGIGPPLMDELWIYGGSGQNIHDTIVQGRPNGMPSYGGHIPDDQIWMITAYVRTLSGQVPKPERPTRSDELFPHPSEQAMPRKTPRPQKVNHPG